MIFCKGVSHSTAEDECTQSFVMAEEIWIVKTFVILQKRVKPIIETALRMPEHLAYCNSNTKTTCKVPHI
jgi:hypothetical protein